MSNRPADPTPKRTGPDWWRGAILYQIYPRSFQDDNGDGIGDLPGITRRLDHVASLGCDGIWLSPIFPSPMADMGYDVSDYVDIDPLFGTLADFEALILRAHDLGLKVVVDQVMNHSSSLHPWFVESRSSRDNPRADWYVWKDPKPDGSPPNNWPSVFGGPAWTWDGERRQYYLHSFLAEQPDLNYLNPDVQQAVLDAMRFWLERGVDGFRLDTVNYFFYDPELRDNPAKSFGTEKPPVNHYDWQLHLYSKSRPENVDFLRRMRALTDEFPDRMLLGEVGDTDQAIELMGEYTSGSDKLHMAYSFDMLSDHYTPAHFREVIDGFWEGAPDGWPLWSMSNHDVVRHATRWAAKDSGDDALARQAISLLLAFEGSICLYQGEELGQTETDLLYSELTDPVGLRFWPANKGRDGCRTPMVWVAQDAQGGFTTGTPWLPVKPPQAARAVDLQEANTASILTHYRKMISYRRATPALDHGKMHFTEAPDPVLRFTRGEGAERLDCVFNLSTSPQQVPCKGTIVGPSQAAGLADDVLSLGANGWAFVTDSDAG